jgi:adhesin transport system outer membrane protein
MTKLLKSALLASVFTFGLAILPVSAEELSLEDALTRGLHSNPEYGVVANNRRATDEELRQARGLFLPSIDLAASTGVEWTDDQGTALAGVDDKTRGIYDYSATLTQMLFDGFGASNEVDRQEARTKSAAFRVHETAEFVGLSIVESYLEVLRQRDLLKIARDNIQEHISMLNEIVATVQAGRSTEADIAQAEARLAAARANESNVKEALRVAEAQYIREIGEQPDILIMPVLPVEAVAQDVDDAVTVAITNSPTLGVFESDMDVAWEEYEATEAGFWPEVDLQLQGRQNDDIGGQDGNDKSASAQIVANWNIYRGGIDTALRREHVYRHAQAKESRTDAARNLENDVRQTWAAMVSAGERANEFAAQAVANEKVVAAYKDQFELDRRTLLDVLDSQNELFVSRSNAVNSEYLEMLAVYRLLALKGKLLPTMGASVPVEATAQLVDY